jgi:hypothetical protein
MSIEVNMKVWHLIEALSRMDPMAEVKIATADGGQPLVDEITKVNGSFLSVLLQGATFEDELLKRAKAEGKRLGMSANLTVVKD